VVAAVWPNSGAAVVAAGRPNSVPAPVVVVAAGCPNSELQFSTLIYLNNTHLLFGKTVYLDVVAVGCPKRGAEGAEVDAAPAIGCPKSDLRDFYK
jgi:hypothetical protein